MLKTAKVKLKLRETKALHHFVGGMIPWHTIS
nr:MAG TPA: hypothetical protein [Caudoviricetes sp.]